ncbi:dihydrolipoamide acetyltransferase family protein [Saccharicrinis sp. FJH54]|uniref:dihydrolipoamide acetyltransferase family protein n=1 Tax=Saccharicrinis sp. FJH54 TaxID=3344665 RepID=UPI0035D429C8
MASFNIVMPKMGESIQEATITKWFVKPGDKVEEDDVLLEIATDKVDSEVPSPVDGVVKEVLFKEDDTVAVGEVIAIIDMEGEAGGDDDSGETKEETSGGDSEQKEDKDSGEQKDDQQSEPDEESKEPGARSSSGKFFSPVVRKIAKENGLSESDLDSIKGSGLNGRVNKEDVLAFIEDGGEAKEAKAEPKTEKAASKPAAPQQPTQAAKIEISVSGEDEIVEMDRMRKKIAEHMVSSKQISPHVTSVVEADVTTLVNWRNRVKDEFQKKYGQKLTFMPVFTEAVAKALRDFPWVNASVNGDQIILKKNVNIGVAVALPSGNLIVPVVKNADMMNLAGLASNMNSLAAKARENKLSPDDIQGGTFTITNFGSFDNIIGTPIINQPQVAILATGSIKKKVSVIETPEGDTIGIRSKMYLSLSYDHRIVDGMLGGKFLRRVGDYLEKFDPERTV